MGRVGRGREWESAAGEQKVTVWVGTRRQSGGLTGGEARWIADSAVRREPNGDRRESDTGLGRYVRVHDRRRERGKERVEKKEREVEKKSRSVTFYNHTCV